MTEFQLLMLGASAYFAFKIYEHVQTLEDPKNQRDNKDNVNNNYTNPTTKTIEAFSPLSADELIEKADIAFEEEDYKKALAFLQEADAKDGGNADILFKIGYILQNQDNDEALDYYKKALEVDKENKYIHNAMASIYRKNKEFISAQMHIRASLDIDANHAITYYNYGNLLIDMDNNEEAIVMYKKAIELNPDFEEAKMELTKLV